jgi:hypothetical protein
MTWFGELRHLVGKDLTEHRWTVGLYLVAVLVATGHMVGWHPFTAPVLGSTMVFVGLIGGVLVASIVQGDSPTRSDAFWASHPIDASAMLASKLLLGFAVLVVPIVAQVLALHDYDVSWSEAFASSMHDARLYALIVLGALVIAALTRDLKSFVLTVVAIPIALLICVATLSIKKGSRGVSFNAGDAAVAVLVTACVELNLLAWLYHTRDSRWLTRLAGFALVGLSFIWLGRSSVPDQRKSSPAATGVLQVPLHLDWARGSGLITTAPLAMQLTVDTPPAGTRYSISSTKATARTSDGGTVDVWVASSETGFQPKAATTLPAIPGIRWLNLTAADSAHSERVITLEPVPSDEQREKLRAGVESIVLKGTMDVTQLIATDTVPLAQGATFVRDGRRIEIDSLRRAPNGFSALVLTRQAKGSSMFSPDFDQSEDFVLVNRTRGEGVLLLRFDNGFSGDGMVIPGSTMTSRLVRYSVRYVPNGRPAIDDAWLRGAKMQVIDAVSLGTYQVTLPPLAAPPPER